MEGRVSFDELSGRQLDLAIARHVFGHQVEERPNSRTGEMDAVDAAVRTRRDRFMRQLQRALQWQTGTPSGSSFVAGAAGAGVEPHSENREHLKTFTVSARLHA
jgi:hypothetical protein